jgi:hypothetical protein
VSRCKVAVVDPPYFCQDLAPPKLLVVLVDVPLCEVDRRWIASADAPDGPSIELGIGAVRAIEAALELFDGVVHELLATLA